MFELAAGTPASPSQSSTLRDRLRSALLQPARAPAARVESVTELPDLSGLGGRWYQCDDGPGYVIESVYEAGHVHGSVPLRKALVLDPASLAGQIRDERLSACSPEGFTYIDTETTGMGGAGALVFLAGVARFDADGLLHLRQYLLPSPAYEGGLLGGLAGDLSKGNALVSYNGKSFDLPMLETRYILSRRQSDLRSVPHLDLLHPNRRLLRGEFDSLKLVAMERELLGFERQRDCPSSEVPMRYILFQRTSDPTHILPVLRHNAWDILSLVALAAILAGVVAGERTPLGAARAAEYEGRDADAVRLYQQAMAGTISRAERLEALEHAALCSQRMGEWRQAAEFWQAIVSDPRTRRVSASVALAKIQEHRLKAPGDAANTIASVLGLVLRGLVRPGPPGSETSREALEHRLARLQRKLSGKRAASRSF